MLTSGLLKLATGCSDELALVWVDPINAALERWAINTDQRVAGFLAQVAHESSCFTELEENLSYSAARLMVVWPARFQTLEFAQLYAHQPEKLANFVYAHRMGNGDELTGDGWKYRGKGPLQITGKMNHYWCGVALEQPLIDNPDLLLEPECGAMSAGWFWANHGCNDLMDSNNFKSVCTTINGGLIGYEERQACWNQTKIALGGISMTVKLINPHAGLKAGFLFSSDVHTETALVAAGDATEDLTGGVALVHQYPLSTIVLNATDIAALAYQGVDVLVQDTSGVQYLWDGAKYVTTTDASPFPAIHPTGTYALQTITGVLTWVSTP